MQGNRRVDTQPELRLRSELYSRGLRYRKDVTFYAAGRRVRPDVTFTGPRVAVFVDGCFWHRCPEHATDLSRTSTIGARSSLAILNAIEPMTPRSLRLAGR